MKNTVTKPDRFLKRVRFEATPFQGGVVINR